MHLFFELVVTEFTLRVSVRRRTSHLHLRAGCACAVRRMQPRACSNARFRACT